MIIMERDLRKNQNLLVCIGTGVLMFGFWSVIKGVMTVFLQKDELLSMLESVRESLPAEEVQFFAPAFTIMCAGIGIIVGVVLLMRIFVGLSARKEGMGKGKRKRNRRAYLVFSVILVVITVFSLFADFPTMGKSLEGFLDGIVPVIIDVTSLIMLIELIVAGAKVKTLKRKLEEAKDEEGSS